ncbi:SecDF P1 head subdomain-containing protein [Candidatus Uabimicrobium amorphum]|uniref:SecDF P1 head subdomain domain-containing protein n=1 Tax=Uabimicrobium amorphum TaxID=2596890 RepID=A0A5S9F3W9_UABAM|nr:hypothetical protein [Candidatus Uabimicrobium amorphum]BBM84691.1 hypothetical protein UABAM_03052 [Candidatus Uabimicrobium amorphum]
MKIILLYLLFSVSIYAQSYTYSYSSSDHNKSQQLAIDSAINQLLQKFCEKKHFVYNRNDYKMIFRNPSWAVKQISSSQKKSFFGFKSTINVSLTIDNNMLVTLAGLIKSTRKWSRSLHYKVLPVHKDDGVDLNDLRKLQLPLPHHMEQIGNDEIVVYLPDLDAETLRLVKEEFSGPRGIMLRFVASAKIGVGVDSYKEQQQYERVRRHTQKRDEYFADLKKQGYLWMSGKDKKDYLLWLDDPYNIMTKNFKEVRYNSVNKSVFFSLTKESVTTFATMTKQHQREQLAIISQGKVVAAPVIQSPIVEGEGIIMGMTPVECYELVKLIKAGWVDYLFSLQQEKIQDNLKLPLIEGAYAEVHLAKKTSHSVLQKVCEEVSQKCQITSISDKDYALRIELRDGQKIEDIEQALEVHSDITVKKITFLTTLCSTESQ